MSVLGGDPKGKLAEEPTPGKPFGRLGQSVPPGKPGTAGKIFLNAQSREWPTTAMRPIGGPFDYPDGKFFPGHREL